jgi:hypothetical protein
MGNMQGDEARSSERENAQRHGFNSESERRSRRVADTNNGQNNGENTQGCRGEGRASASSSSSTGSPHSGRGLEVGNNPNPGRYSRDIKKPRTRQKKGARDYRPPAVLCSLVAVTARVLYIVQYTTAHRALGARCYRPPAVLSSELRGL